MTYNYVQLCSVFSTSDRLLLSVININQWELNKDIIVTNGGDISTSSFVFGFASRVKRSSIIFATCRPIFDVFVGHRKWYSLR